MHVSLEQGRQIVALARATLDSFVETGDYRKESKNDGFLKEKRGVFVTLNAVGRDGSMLRGCVGFPYPVIPLGEAIQEAAVSASSEDPRFVPVEPDELPGIVVEVSVLTVPKELNVRDRKDLPTKVRVGEDGLVISTPNASGLLLPQVAKEQGWEPEEFLNQACLKAGLSPDSWLLPETKVQVFQAEVFTEKSPRGDVEQATLPVS